MTRSPSSSCSATEPDVRTDYSNAGFNLVGLVLEEAGGEPLERQLAEHVFAAAGMNQTSLSAEAPDDSRLVHGYDDGHDVTPNDLSGAWAAGAAVSTVRDLDRFLTALFSYRLLDEATVADMTDPRGEIGSGSYGLGLWAYPFDCGAALGHDGAFTGYSTAAFHNPDEDRSMVLMVGRQSKSQRREVQASATSSWPCPSMRRGSTAIKPSTPRRPHLGSSPRPDARVHQSPCPWRVVRSLP